MSQSSNFTFFPCNNSICDGYDLWPYGVSSGGFPTYVNQVTNVFGSLSLWLAPNCTYVTFSVGAEDHGAKASTCQQALQGYSRLDKQRVWQSFVKYWNPNNTIAKVGFVEQAGYAHDDYQMGSNLSQQIYFSNPYLVQPAKKCNSNGVAALANTSYYLGPLDITSCTDTTCTCFMNQPCGARSSASPDVLAALRALLKAFWDKLQASGSEDEE